MMISITPFAANHHVRSHAPSENITLLTGHAKWNYYALGKRFCKKMNSQQTQIKCHAIPSKGSAWNLKQIQSGRYKLAFAQSDITYQFIQTHHKNNKIQILAKLSPQYYFVLVRMNDDIYSLNDLYGKAINLGPLGSGLHGTNQIIFSTLGFLKQNANTSSGSKSVFKKILYQPAPMEAALLCTHQVDAITFILEGDERGHVPRLNKIMQGCSMRILSLRHSEIKKIRDLELGYETATIRPIAALAKPIKTISLKMLLVGEKDLCPFAIK